MKRILLAIAALGVVVIACGQYVTPTPTPTPAPSATRTPTHSPTAPATQTAAALIPVATWTATIRQATVNVRAEPDGAVVGQLSAGDSVQVIECADTWCNVTVPELELTGWVWRGCLDGVQSSAGCVAK